MLNLKLIKAVIQYTNIRFGHKPRVDIKKHIRGTISQLAEANKKRRGMFVRDVRNFLSTNQVKVRF